MSVAAYPSCAEEPVQATASVEQLTAEADKAFARGDTAHMRKCLAAALEKSPKDGELAMALGHVEMSTGSIEAALAAYWSATLLSPRAARAHSCHALAARLLGRNSEASLSAVRAISIDPSDAVALKVLARTHLDAKQPEAARQACRLILRQNANDSDAKQMLDEATVIEARLAENLVEKRSTVVAPPRRTNTPPVAVPHTANGSPVATGPGNVARQNVENFINVGRKFFADVVPPRLTLLHLKNSRVLPSREEILTLVPKGGVCAEIGVQTGAFTKLILSALKPAKLHLFDRNFAFFDQKHVEIAVKLRTVELHPGDPAAHLASQPDHSFDFIYIDDGGAYDTVVKDLEQAANKIKDDGWIVCHAYSVFSPLEGVKYGVCRAVNEFCLNRGFEIRCLGLQRWGYHDVALKRRLA